jgi:molybdopterin-guanine dinucleotide biosynthesis protein A
MQVVNLTDKIAVVVVAGGESTRLGTFKPLAIFKDRPLISWTFDIAFEISQNVYLLLKSPEQESLLKEELSGRGVNVILEPSDGPPYPASLASCLSMVSEDLIFLMGCDTPMLDPRLPHLLQDRIGSYPAAVPLWPNGYVEPLAALYRKGSLPQNAKINNMRELLEVMKAKLVKIEDLGVPPVSFFNINSKEDLELARIMHQLLSIST